MSVKQTGNIAGGSIVGGDMHVTLVNQQVVDEIHALYQKIKQGDSENTEDTFCEQLEHYLAAKTDGDVRGLEEKLRSSDRVDQLDHALRMKERATKSIMRLQSSKTAQRIYTILLDELHTNFMLLVSPLVEAEAPRTIVDDKIQEIIYSLKSTLGENLLEITVKDMLGLLYFLGGNCHIRWDKC